MKYEVITVSETKGEQPTAHLRWRKNMDGEMVLEQAWDITTYQSGLAVNVRHEWRDVPEAP